VLIYAQKIIIDPAATIDTTCGTGGSGSPGAPGGSGNGNGMGGASGGAGPNASAALNGPQFQVLI